MSEPTQTQDGWLLHFNRALLDELHRLVHDVAIAWNATSGWAWTPPIVLAVTAVGIISWISYAHRRWKKGWLSGLIDERLAEIRKARAAPSKRIASKGRRLLAAELRLTTLETWDILLDYFRIKFSKQLREYYFPSRLSFIVLATFITAFFVISRPPQLSHISHWKLLDWWHLLTTDPAGANARTEELIVGAFTGLAIVVIALIVFVAESIRDNKDHERKRILIRISYLWPLGVAATLIPFGFLWSASRGSTILLEIVVASITLISFARVVRALFDPEIQASDRLKFLRRRVSGAISESVRERIGNSILFERLGSGKSINTLHYLNSRVWIEDQSYHFIDAPQSGWISDIQLDELKKLGDRLDRYARENFGFSLRESGPDIQPAGAGGGPTASPTKRVAVQKAYLLKRYRGEVPPDSIFHGDSRSILALPERLASPPVLADIDASIAHIFRFSKVDPSSVAIRREMQGTKDQLAQAIRDHALGEIDELRQTYLQIAEEFLTQLVELGGGYSAEQARKERGNYFESWTEIRWLLSDLRELITIAADAGNTDVLGQIAFVPFAIAARAVKARDHFVFQWFYQFALFLYALGSDAARSSSLRDWLIEKSWRWPKEIADFYVDHELNLRNSSPEELELMRDFALDSLRVFQDLLKLIVDKRDVSAFDAASLEFRRLYRRFRETDRNSRLTGLRFELNQVQADEQRQAIIAELDRLQKCEDISGIINLAIDEIFLALGGRILAQHLAAPEDSNTRLLLEKILLLLPNTMQRLAVVFADATNLEASDRWGWNTWDLVADGEAHWIDTHTKLNQIFALKALQLLTALSLDARLAVQLPLGEALAEAAREGNPQGLLTTLDAIEANPQRWQSVLNDESKECIGLLRTKLLTVWHTEQELNVERVRNAPLDPQKVETFRSDFLQSFFESGRVRNILKAKGALEIDLGKSPGSPVQSFGFSQIDDKNAFLAQDRIHYGGWGRGYGQSLAQGEDEASFAKMLAGAKDRQTIIPGAIIATIFDAISRTSFTDPIILQSLEFDVRYSIDRNSNFTPHYAPDLDGTPWRDFNGFMGTMTLGTRKIPVFDTFVRRPEAQNHVLILDPRNYVRWRQFAPNQESDEQTYADGQLAIQVIDLNANIEKRDEIIARNPLWLSEEDDPTAYLRSRVLINVSEKFQIEILDASRAICLTVQQEI
jgi:hypothetical protein